MKLLKTITVKTEKGCPLFEARDEDASNNCLNCVSWPYPVGTPLLRCMREKEVRSLAQVSG
jgi:hypothetical protein